MGLDGFCVVCLFVGKYDRFAVAWVLLKVWGSGFCSDTKLMQDNNGENRINGKRDRNKQNKP